MRKYTILAILFVIAFVVRLPFVQYEPTNESFEILRHIQSVSETGEPLYVDSQTFLGRERLVNAFAVYALHTISIFTAEPFILKLVLALLGSAIILPVFILAQKLLTNESHQIIITIFSAVMPLFIRETTYDISLRAISYPLFLTFLLLFFLKPSKMRSTLALLVPIAASLLSAQFGVLLFGVLVYFGLLKIEGRKADNFQIEVTAYALLVYIISTYIIYKPAILAHGIGFIQVVNSTVDSAVAHINVFFVFIAIYLMYRCFFHTHRKEVLLLTSIFVASVFGGLLAFASSTTMVLYMNFVMLLLVGLFLDKVKKYFLETNFAKKTKWIISGIVIILAVSWLLPFVLLAEPQENEELLDRISQLPQSALIIAPANLGNKIAYTTNRSVLLEQDVTLVPEAQQILFTIQSIQTDVSQASVLQKLSTITLQRPLYILSPETPPYGGDPCFPVERVYQFTLMEVTCRERN